MTDTSANEWLPGLTDPVEIGRGGFGVVYKAVETDLNRTVAVKILSGALDDLARQRFDRERRAMGALSGHPNIVSIYRTGLTADNRPYLVMEFLTNGSMADRLASLGQLTWRDTVDAGVRLCAALETAHQAGVLHRDVKPENVFLSALGAPKLGDFGIARLEGAPQTQSAMITASLAHASPELIDGRPPSVQSDIYGLASTLVTLLRGQPPFVRDTDESIVPMLARIATEAVPDLRVQGVHDAVASAFEKAMAKDPAERYVSVAEFGRALQRAQRTAGVPVTPLEVQGIEPTEPHGEGAPVADEISGGGSPGAAGAGAAGASSSAPTGSLSLGGPATAPPGAPGAPPPVAAPPGAGSAGARPPAAAPPGGGAPPIGVPPSRLPGGAPGSGPGVSGPGAPGPTPPPQSGLPPLPGPGTPGPGVGARSPGKAVAGSVSGAPGPASSLPPGHPDRVADPPGPGRPPPVTGPSAQPPGSSGPKPAPVLIVGGVLAVVVVLILVVVVLGGDDSTTSQATDTTGGTVTAAATDDPDGPPPSLAPGTAGPEGRTVTAIPYNLGDNERLDELTVDCSSGVLDQCDELYFASPRGSLFEAFGATCGERALFLGTTACSERDDLEGG